MKKALVGSGISSLALIVGGTVLLRRVLRVYAVDLLARARSGM